MKNKIDIKSLVLGALLGAVVVLSAAAATTSGGRTVWEYQTVQGTVQGNEAKLDDAINKQGSQGWEFVSASHSTEKYGFAIMRREKK